MPAILKGLEMKQDAIGNIYNGDLESLKNILIDKSDIHIYTVNNLMGAKHNEEYRIGLISLILKAEAEHPKQFFKYKALIDCITKIKGANYVVFGWRNPNFSKYTKEDSSINQKNLTVPVSKQMKTYLRHLEVREIGTRKKKITLLKEIDEEVKSSTPEVRAAAQLIKRQIVKNYRLLNPKSSER